jgi:hypothetical protein
MASTQPVSFTSPGFDYSADVASIDRKRKLAEALQAQSFQPIQAATANGIQTPVSWTQGLAKLAEAWASGRQEKAADKEQRELAERSQNDYKNMLTSGLSKLQGSPVSEDASGNVTPAQPPDPMGAMAAFGAHPMGAQFLPLPMQELQRQRLALALRGPQSAPAAPSANVQLAGPATPGAMPAAPQGQIAGAGGPAGGIPMDAWLAQDPSGKTYLEQLAKDHTEGQKPVVNRGFGIGRMVNGQYVPDQASQEQALALERGKRDITAPMETPVTIRTSSGQDIQLSRPEYAEYQKSGRLPDRYGQQAPAAPTEALPPNVPPEHAAAYQAVLDASRKGIKASASPAQAQPGQGLGTIGATQSQADTIRQEGQKASNVEAGKEFIAEMRQNYSKLRDVPATLANIEHAKTLAAGSAASFMGPLGESKLAIAKFLRANVPGMGNLNTEKVTSVEELRSTLFNQVMDNLKKMDASPSQYQQQVMQEAFGTLGTDPQSVPKILDTFGSILRNRVDIHNQTVTSAEARGTTFPHDVSIKLDALPKPNAVKDIVNSGSPASSKRVKWSDLGR